jgi:hypothetical protein
MGRKRLLTGATGDISGEDESFSELEPAHLSTHLFFLLDDDLLLDPLLLLEDEDGFLAFLDETDDREDPPGALKSPKQPMEAALLM